MGNLPAAMMLLGAPGVGKSTIAEKIRAMGCHGVRCGVDDLAGRFAVKSIIQADVLIVEDPDTRRVKLKEAFVGVVKDFLYGGSVIVEKQGQEQMYRSFRGLLVFVGNEVPDWMETPSMHRLIPTVRVLGHQA